MRRQIELLQHRVDGSKQVGFLQLLTRDVDADRVLQSGGVGRQPTGELASTRFVKEPNYAYYMSNLNLFTYLIKHADGNPNNFLA